MADSPIVSSKSSESPESPRPASRPDDERSADIRAWLCECISDDAQVADGYDDAFLGFVTFDGGSRSVAVYDYAGCVDVLTGQGDMDEDEAEEFLNFNVTGAYNGEMTPAYAVLWPGGRALLAKRLLSSLDTASLEAEIARRLVAAPVKKEDDADG